MTGILLRWLNHPAPMRSLARKAVKAFSLFSYEDRLRFCAIDRPHYGHCLFEAAKLAAQLNYPQISAIEFGCGGGNGLLCAEMHVSEIEKVCPVKFELYGFDSGEGLPAANDYRDFPYYFNPGRFKMDVDELRSRLKRAKIVIGNIGITCQYFWYLCILTISSEITFGYLASVPESCWRFMNLTVIILRGRLQLIVQCQ